MKEEVVDYVKCIEGALRRIGRDSDKTRKIEAGLSAARIVNVESVVELRDTLKEDFAELPQDVQISVANSCGGVFKDDDVAAAAAAEAPTP